MQQNKLTIRIKKPVAEVFGFTITPSNTPKWIGSIVEEKIQGDLIQVGTIYTNQDTKGVTNTYSVSKMEDNKVFEMQSVPPGYTVRYTYTSISPEETELEYFEWVESAELSGPFTQSVLEKLKLVLETE